jgi:type II secretory ATPase GspE/PulE/Tfp pilus assembly ATPase PilB-like protein
MPQVLSDAALDELAGQYLGSGVAGDDNPTARAVLVAQWRGRHGNAAGQVRLFKSGACAACEGHGYHGRLGLHELMLADEQVSELVRHRAPASALQAAALAGGMVTLRQDGIDKALAGLTDMAEVLAASNT